MNRIQENISKALLLIITVITLIAPTNVFAKADYEKLENANGNVMYGCTDSSCMPLCIYTNKSGTNVGYIGYYFNTDVNGKTGFEINALEIHRNYVDEEEPTGKMVYSFWDPSGKIPTSSIYWSKIKGKPWDKATDPEKKTGYFLLDEGLECPNYISIDMEAYTELCFSDHKYTCKKEQNTPAVTIFTDGYELSYSFIDEFKKIIDQAYRENYLYDSVTAKAIYALNPDELEKLEMKKVEFIYDLDPDMTINIEESPEENATRYCEYLKENMQKENIETYMEKLKKEHAERFSEKFMESIEQARKQYGSSHASQPFYMNKENIEKLLKDRRVKDNNDKNYYDKIHSIYEESYGNSMKYFEEKCKDLADIDIGYKEHSEELKEKIRENYESIVYGNISIDDTKKLSCGDISELADLIKTAYFIIEVIAIIILIGLSSLDYAKVILNGEQDEIKKCNKKLLTRLIITVIIFLLPGLINFTLKIFNIEGFNSETPLCVEISNK